MLNGVKYTKCVFPRKIVSAPSKTVVYIENLYEMQKIAIITTHPIQYNAPLFKLLAKEKGILLKVFYTWGEASIGPKYDPEFGKEIEWDIPLLDGYNYTFIKNTSKEPGSHHFKGIINPTLNKEIEEWSPHVLWVWGWAFDSHLKAMRYFKGKVPIWFRGDSTLLDEVKGFLMKKAFRRLFLTWVYKHVDKAFYVGTHNKAYFKAHGLKENQLVYAPHAIDNGRFADPKGEFAADAKTWRTQLGIDEGSRVLLFVGKFEQKKNPFFFRKLIEKTKQKGVVGLMVGNGSLECDLKKNAPENLLFLPFQNQSKMPVVYRLANALVLPSQSETWGLVMNEALASGIPIVASEKCGGAIDLISSANGYLLKFENPDFNDLVSWIDKFNIREFRTQNADFLERFSYQKIVQQVLNEL